MILRDISLVNFKNFAQAELKFSEKINCLVGNNGVGKTNLLDSIYYLSFCKSFFNMPDIQNIKHNEPFFVIEGNFQINSEQKECVYCGYKLGHKKIFKRNNKEYKKLSEHIGLIPLVIVSPNDSQLISSGSDERRRFIDGVISQYDKSYLEYLIKYNRVLEQRNKLLKDFAEKKIFSNEMIELWDVQLVTLGNKIYKSRIDFIEKLLPIFQKYYSFISDKNETVELIYDSQLHKAEMLDLLQKSIEKDMAFHYTTAGIHKDDLDLKLNGYPMKKIGSQGQQKTYLVALKLAQFDFIKEVYKFNPVLLLDDIFDKLDAFRVTQIINLVADKHFGQIFITDTNKEHIKTILSTNNIDYKLFHIENNTIQIEN